MEKRIILNEEGEKLAGILYANQKSRTLAILCHGFLMNKDAIFFPELAKALSREMAVFCFDFSGCGESQGDLEKNSLLKEVRDLKKIIEEVGKGYSSVGLIGHSKGATIATLAAEDTKVNFLICIAGVAYPYQKFLTSISEEQRRELLHGARISLEPFFNVKAFLTKDMVEGLEKIDVPKSARQIKCPVLLVHAKDDELVPYPEAVEMANIFPNVKLKTLEQGGHFLNRKAPKQELIDEVIKWIRAKIVLV